MDAAWPWVILALLGAYHGLNPAMGWLFAVALGMQERRRSAVTGALIPIALGHELVDRARWRRSCSGSGCSRTRARCTSGAGLALIAFGIFRFVKPRAHPRWTTMRVNRRELTWWSFLMSSAHGAGLMVAPVLIGAGAEEATASSDHALEAVRSGAMSIPESGLAIMLHVGGDDRRHGRGRRASSTSASASAILRKAWLNLDQLWAGAFVLAGVLTLVT